MTAFRIFLASFAAMLLALVLANILPEPHHHLAGTLILPLFAIMVLSLIVVRRQQGKDRTGKPDCNRTYRDGMNVGSQAEGAGHDAG